MSGPRTEDTGDRGHRGHKMDSLVRVCRVFRVLRRVSFVSLHLVSLSCRQTAAMKPRRSASGVCARSTRRIRPATRRKAADFLASIFEREGIPFTRYESAPGKSIVYARLKATASPPAGKAIVLLHHMDVVPGRSRAVDDRPVQRDHPGQGAVGPRRDGHEGAGHRPPDGVSQAEARARAAVARRDPAGRARRRGRRRARARAG